VERGETFRDWAPGEADARRAEISRELVALARRRLASDKGWHG
jgi:hypothetical protein